MKSNEIEYEISIDLLTLILGKNEDSSGPEHELACVPLHFQRKTEMYFRDSFQHLFVSKMTVKSSVYKYWTL